MGAEERLVVIAGNEADFLAVHFVGDLEAEFAGDGADLRFGHAAERGESAAELLLAEAEKKIRLVFAVVAAFAQDAAVGVMFDNGVVAGGDVFRAEGGGLGPEVAELEQFVAHHAGIRGAAGAVFAGEIVDDEFLELVSFIHDVVRHAEFVRYTAGVGDGGGAAAFVLGPRNAVLRPDLHGHADDIVALLFEQMGGHAGVHPSAHSHEHAFFVSRHGREYRGKIPCGNPRVESTVAALVRAWEEAWRSERICNF